MIAHSFQCPACGAPLVPRGSASVISCPYCHTSVVVPEALRQVSGAAAWSTLVYDNFTSNDNHWLVGSETSEYFTQLSRVIADGRYRWEVGESRLSFISSAWLMGYPVTDFHLRANGKRIRGSRTGSGWGVNFRVQDNRNYYWFRMLDSQFFAVWAVKDSQWTSLVDSARSDAIKPNGVNQMEVIARDSHFIFLINGQLVGEADDDYFSQGVVGLAVEGFPSSGEDLTFDFMDITLRAP